MLRKDLLDETIEQKIQTQQEKNQYRADKNKKPLFRDSLTVHDDIRRSTWGQKQAQALLAIQKLCDQKNQENKRKTQIKQIHMEEKKDLQNKKGQKKQQNKEKKEQKIKQNEAIFHRPTIHLRSMIANLAWIFAFVIFIPETLAGIINLDGLTLFLVLLAFYVFYLLLGLIKNTLMEYLKDQNISRGEDFQLQYNNVRAKAGHFTFFAQCYHYETKTKTITIATQNGTTTQKITYVQKVVTHTARQNVYPKKTVDISGRIKAISYFKQILFVHNIVNYKFKDDQSRLAYDELWENFKLKNKKDTHQLYIDDYVIPNLKERLTFYVQEKPKNYQVLLIIWTIFGLLWPFSIFVQAKAQRYEIDYMKVVTM